MGRGRLAAPGRGANGAAHTQGRACPLAVCQGLCALPGLRCGQGLARGVLAPLQPEGRHREGLDAASPAAPDAARWPRACPGTPGVGPAGTRTHAGHLCLGRSSSSHTGSTGRAGTRGVPAQHPLSGRSWPSVSERQGWRVSAHFQPEAKRGPSLSAGSAGQQFWNQPPGQVPSLHSLDLQDDGHCPKPVSTRRPGH